MQKLVKILVVVLAIAFGLFIYTKFSQTGFSNLIVDRFTPPNKEIKNFLPLGKDLDYQIKIADGFRMGVFADLGSGRPRVLAQDPNGVIVASLTSEGKVVALADKNGDGISDQQINILTGLNSPHGLLFDGNDLYVAESGRVSRYYYDKNTFKVSQKKELFQLPTGGGHFTRTIKVFGDKLYTSVGSSCNVCNEKDKNRAAVLVSDLDGNNLRVYASGLRNTVFFTRDSSGRIWGNDMGRDLLGDNLPPDELNIISEGNYGWPYCYGQKIRDGSFEGGTKENYCVNTKPPIFEYPAHVAPLGITFISSDLFSPSDQGSLLVAMHGSWNSSVPVGYKIVKLSILGGEVTQVEDFITGFIKNGEVLGRPVDLMFDNKGYLYISDDKSGLIYVVSKG